MNLNLPPCSLKIELLSPDSKRKSVFDIVRKQWVALTPEEYVRQSFVHYMINSLAVPITHISIEQSFQFENGKAQRADIVVYDGSAAPFILVECKASTVKITDEIFLQATRYNAYIKAKYIVVTNGLNHYCVTTDNFIDYTFEKEIPKYRVTFLQR